MRVALFVEGSAPLGSKDHCRTLWNDTLLPALGRAPVDLVVPIGKDAISRLRNLRTSSSAPGLDARIATIRRAHDLDPERDALVIAWDLEPIDPDRERCAWDEKVGLYDGIAASPLLASTAWAADAARRARALRAIQGRPASRQNASKVVPGSVLALCMDPLFEALLARDGRAVRRALGLDTDPPDWPTGWSATERDPSTRLLGRAIAAMRQLRPRPPIRRHIRENWQNAKDEWGDYLLRKLLAEPTQAAAIHAHPIAARLRHILPPAR
jgi:hypothetical protein